MHKNAAQNIAESASEIIGYGVLVTDENGIIIGCSDPKRVGTLHAPSLKVMTERVPLHTTKEEALLLDGVKPGYTCYIDIGGQKIVGTVSIAGPPEKVERYGMLVKKHAEIMLREQSIFESHIRKEQAFRDLAQNIIMFSPEDENEQSLLIQGRELGYNLECCRIAVVFEIKHANGEWAAALQFIRNFFSKPSHLIAHLRDFQVVAFLDMPCGKGDGEMEKAVHELCHSLLEQISEFHADVDIGIGIESKSLKELAVSGRIAREALFVGKAAGNGRVHSSKKLLLEIMLASVSRKRRNHYMDEILHKFDESDKDGELLKTFKVWSETPSSAAEAAQKLSIHRNTLQYRLKRICEITGLNIFSLHDSFVLWSAITLQKLESGKTILKDYKV